MVATVTIKTDAGLSGITWLNISGTTSEVVQEIANQKFSARNVVQIQYSTDGTTAIALACRRE